MTHRQHNFNYLLPLLLFCFSPFAHAATLKWKAADGSEIPVTIASATAKTNGLPVIVYLENLAAPRTGTEADHTIWMDFVNGGYLVAEMNFSGRTNARVPFINRDLGKLRDDIRAKKFLGEYNVDDAHIFIVPEGC